MTDPSMQDQQPLAPSPVMTSDQILNHLDAVHQSLPEPVKAALDAAHTNLGGAPGSSLTGISKPAPAESIAPAPVEASMSSPGIAPVPVVPGASQAPPAPAVPLSPPSFNGGAPVQSSLQAAGIPDHAGPVAPPPLTTAERLGKMESEGSGISQIKNPWLRGLATAGDVVASGVFPRFGAFVPGTTAHHLLLERGLQRQVGNEENEQKAADESRLQNANAANKETSTGLLADEAKSKEGLEGAQAANYISETEARKNPDNQQITHPVIDPKDPTKTPRIGWSDKKTNAMTYGPAVGALPVTPKPPTNEFEKFFQDNPKATAEDWAKFQTAHPKPMEWSAEDAALLHSVGGDPSKPETLTFPVMKKFRDLKTEHITVPPDRGVSVFDPSGKLVRVEPGQSAPAGALTPSNFSGQNAAVDKRTQATQEAAQQAQDDYSLAKELTDHPSPTNDIALVMHYIGATKPDSLGKLRLNGNELKMVFGARSSFGDLEALMNKVASGQSLTAKQRSDMLATMKTIADGSKAKTGGASQAPGQVRSQADFDALPKGAIYTGEDGKQYRKP